MATRTSTRAEVAAGAVQASVRLLARRLRAVEVDGDLTPSETSALARLDHGGPMGPSDLARSEQVTPQSMGAIVAALESRGLVERRADPADGRRAVISPTRAGLALLRSRRSVKAERMAEVVAEHFDRSEQERLREAAELIERLAEHL